MNVSAEQLAELLTVVSGRPATVVKAADESEDDEVRLNDTTWVQVGAYYAIVFRARGDRILKQDAVNVYEVIQGLNHLDADVLVPDPHLRQF